MCSKERPHHTQNIDLMHPINSLSEAVRVVHYYIAEKRGWKSTKKRRNMICWRDAKGGMVGPRRIWITEYAKDVYRVKGGLTGAFIKSVWPFEMPDQRGFELTLHASEVTCDLVNELLPVVSASYNDFLDVPPLKPFENVDGYPGYAWTAKATAAYEATRPKDRT
jgi:hypothetical protein